jgi:hypothetical protein
LKKTIRSEDFAAVVAKEFDILVDTDKARGPVIGLKVNPVDGPPFIMPITFKAAKDMAINILKTLLFVAPELFQ